MRHVLHVVWPLIAVCGSESLHALMDAHCFRSTVTPCIHIQDSITYLTCSSKFKLWGNLLDYRILKLGFTLITSLWMLHNYTCPYLKSLRLGCSFYWTTRGYIVTLRAFTIQVVMLMQYLRNWKLHLRKFYSKIFLISFTVIQSCCNSLIVDFLRLLFLNCVQVMCLHGHFIFMKPQIMMPIIQCCTTSVKCLSVKGHLTAVVAFEVLNLSNFMNTDVAMLLFFKINKWSFYSDITTLLVVINLIIYDLNVLYSSKLVTQTLQHYLMAHWTT